MGFNLAVWDNHVGNNQHSFQPSVSLSLFTYLTQKNVQTCVVKISAEKFYNDISLTGFTLKFSIWIPELNLMDWEIMNNFSYRLIFCVSQLELHVDVAASLSPVYAFNSKLKIIHHSIVDFHHHWFWGCFLNEPKENGKIATWRDLCSYNIGFLLHRDKSLHDYQYTPLGSLPFPIKYSSKVSRLNVF